MANFKKFLKQYGGDNQISGTDIKKATQAGYSFADLDAFTQKAKKKGLKTGNSTQIQLDKAAKNKASSSSPPSSSNTPPGATTTDFNIDNYKDVALFDHTLATNLLDKSLSSNEAITALQTEAQKYVADANAGASMYASDANIEIAGITSASEERWRKYLADQQRLGAENVATIQGGYSLDLQNIVNAGAQDVAKIQGEYGIEGIKLQGEYGLESDRIKGDTARDVASRQKDAQIFGSLMSGFW
jgi:hypothetical protein